MIPYVKLLDQMCLESRNLHILEKCYSAYTICYVTAPKQHLNVAAEKCVRSTLK